MSRPVHMKTTSLCLGSTDDDFVRRFARLPFAGKVHIIAYGGDDGSITLIEGNMVKTARRFSERIRSVASSYDGKRVAVGFGDGSTTVFAYESLEGDFHPFLSSLRKSDDDDGIFSQIDDINEDNVDEVYFPGPCYQTPVRSLAFDPRESYMLACGSEDSGFCIVDASSMDTLVKKRFLAEQSANEHNETGIRGLAYHVGESKTILASLDLQGRLCVWDVTGSDPELDYELLHKDGHKSVMKVDQGDINDSEPADQACFPIFCKSFLGLPGSNDLQLRSVDALDKQLFLSSVDGRGHLEPIVSLAFSEDCKYAVTAGRDERIVLWKVEQTGDLIGTFVRIYAEVPSVCTHILWAGSTVHFAFQNGSFATVAEADLVATQARRKGKSFVAESNSTNGKVENVNKRKSTSKTADAEMESDDEGIKFVDGDNTQRKVQVSFLFDGEDEDINDSESPEATDFDGAMGETGSNGDEMDEDEYDFHSPSRSGMKAIELREPQPAFSPSSTPLDLPRRIMCWNHVGVITLLRGDDGVIRNSIDIDFTDSAFRRPLSFTDNMDFIIGSLGEDGAFFATDLPEDDDIDDDVDLVVKGLNMSDKTMAALKSNHKERVRKGRQGIKSTGSRVYFHRFETFGNLNNKDWVVALPDAELVMGCATGVGWAACMTNRRFLRTFTAGGNQSAVVWIKGDPITIVGRSRFVAIFYHEGIPMPDGTQNIGFAIYDAISTEKVFDGSLPCLSARSSLSWAGFSKEGSLMVMDSNGMLSMLAVDAKRFADKDSHSFCWSWSPVLDTVGLRKSRDDSFWPVTAQDGKLICVPLKGGNGYPDTARRPVTSALSLRMPFAYGADKSTALDELSVRAKLALNQKKFMVNHIRSLGYDVTELEEEFNGLCAQVDKVTLKLFMATVETGKVERSLDLVERLHLEKSFEIAITISERMNQRSLSDKIEEIRDRCFAVYDEDDEAEDDEAFETDALFPDSQHCDHATETKPTPKRSSRNISPESQIIPRNKRLIDEVHQEEVTVRRAKVNPFAKARIASPARPSLSPRKESPARIGISRLSSFSARSRETTKINKKLI